jgi:hypothetical protein
MEGDSMKPCELTATITAIVTLKRFAAKHKKLPKT